VETKTGLLQQFAKRLFEAEQQRTTIEPPSTQIPDLTLEDAYKIQDEIAALKRTAGLRHIGWKTALTNPLLRQRTQAPEPTRGYLFEPALLASREARGPGFLIEPEVTFYLDADITGPAVTPEEVLAATRGVCASLEVAGGRYGNRVSFVDLAADNAGATHMVVSDLVLSPDDAGDPGRLASLSVELMKNGELVQSGTGVDVMGGPAHAVAWLANQLYTSGKMLRRGQVILSGSFTLPVPAAPGDRVAARFDMLGTIEVSVT